MNQKVKKNKDNNNSSNSLVFGRWPQTKMNLIACLHEQTNYKDEVATVFYLALKPNSFVTPDNKMAFVLVR